MWQSRETPPKISVSYRTALGETVVERGLRTRIYYQEYPAACCGVFYCRCPLNLLYFNAISEENISFWANLLQELTS